MKLSYLYGCRFGTWRRLASENGVVLGPTSLGHAGAITLLSLINSGLARTFGRIEGAERAEVRAPIFVLGHWRSGTTHLQYLLSQDPRFVSPNTYEVCFPDSLGAERWYGRLLQAVLPPTRLQDGMHFGAAVPNEDEIALAALGLPSPYHLWGFPAREDEHLRHLSFRSASAADRERFLAGLDGYLRALTAKHGKRLLLKSPTHTARLELLLGAYPDAQFVHIHRHPYDVFQSTRHLHQTWLAHTAFLQPPDAHGLDDRILETYQQLYDAYFEDLPSLPAGQIHELGYADLVSDPLGQLGALYDALGLGAVPEARLQRYLAARRGYRTNRYAPLTDDERRRVYRAWRRSFDVWGYDPGSAGRSAALSAARGSAALSAAGSPHSVRPRSATPLEGTDPHRQASAPQTGRTQSGGPTGRAERDAPSVPPGASP